MTSYSGDVPLDVDTALMRGGTITTDDYYYIRIISLLFTLSQGI